ncbi:hypothetical protein K504DRAFT_111443 [Pleomassaria siparia CBS 279.74]|uniref:Uncharacterized protein n=1 Tax=Pleomassaria siparia CBS 279.74 TaxID=1314801 RepID=A0A6G1JVY9_9PLEO|nr:hypothetical protein K504DRAFT_111443 [Pleomassaria siparia CBS 279.74]
MASASGKWIFLFFLIKARYPISLYQDFLLLYFQVTHSNKSTWFSVLCWAISHVRVSSAVDIPTGMYSFKLIISRIK